MLRILWAFAIVLLPLRLAAQEFATLPYDAIYELGTKTPGHDTVFYVWSENREVKNTDIVIELIVGEKAIETIHVGNDAVARFPLRAELYHQGGVLRANQPKGTLVLRYLFANNVDFDPDEKGVVDYDTAMAPLHERSAVVHEIIAHTLTDPAQVKSAKADSLSLLLASADGTGFSLAVVCDGRPVANVTAEKDGTISVPYDDGLWNKHATIVVTPATTRFRKNNTTPIP